MPVDMRNAIVVMLAALVIAGCASKPLVPYTADTTPLMLVPAIQSMEQDERGRFREIFCEVLETRKDSIPDYRSCDEAITRVAREPRGAGRAVTLGPAHRRLKILFVPGVGWDCFAKWLAIEDTIPEHLRQFGYDMETVDIDGLASSASNAKKIRDVILDTPQDGTQSDLVLLGYSKGAADVLVTLANYPEILGRIAAVVSLAGAIGGSPLANDASDDQLNLLQHFPGATCKPLDGGALPDMRPETRKAWLAGHALPAGIAYYSMITFPAPDRISALLSSSYHKLSQVDARNDSQLIFYDQFLPNSALVAYLNADHWAVAVPIARTHDAVGALLVDQNAYPREALYEALLRLIEEDLEKAGKSSS
jgi:dienelactone hydrolase